MVKTSRSSRGNVLELARVLVVDDDPACRLTLQTVLEAGGYRVDAAATAAEAVGKMDQQEYELVLSDMDMESPEAGLRVLAHAQLKEYRPATALVTTYLTAQQRSSTAPQGSRKSRVLVQPEDLPELLTKVASLISQRATRIVQRRIRAVRN